MLDGHLAEGYTRISQQSKADHSSAFFQMHVLRVLVLCDLTTFTVEAQEIAFHLHGKQYVELSS